MVLSAGLQAFQDDSVPVKSQIRLNPLDGRIKRYNAGFSIANPYPSVVAKSSCRPRHVHVGRQNTFGVTNSGNHIGKEAEVNAVRFDRDVYGPVGEQGLALPLRQVQRESPPSRRFPAGGLHQSQINRRLTIHITKRSGKRLKTNPDDVAIPDVQLGLDAGIVRRSGQGNSPAKCAAQVPRHPQDRRPCLQIQPFEA